MEVKVSDKELFEELLNRVKLSGIEVNSDSNGCTKFVYNDHVIGEFNYDGYSLLFNLVRLGKVLEKFDYK